MGRLRWRTIARGTVAVASIAGCSSAGSANQSASNAAAPAPPATNPPLPRCAGEPGAAAPAPQRTLLATIADPTCLAAIWWDPSAGVLSVPVTVEPSSTSARRRFALGSAGDEVVLGDWDCDGRATPAVYRPATGEVHLFAAWPTDAVPEPAVRVDATGVVDGSVSVAASAPGTSCQEVRVEP